MDPISLVNKLRVMAIQADPPEIRPGEGTTLRVLFQDPEGKGREVQIVWFVSLGNFNPVEEPSEERADEPEILGFHFGTASDGADELVVPPVREDILDEIDLDELSENQREEFEKLNYRALTATTVVLLCAGGELPVDMEDPGAFGDPEDICRGGDGLMAVKTFSISDQDDANRNTNPEIATMKSDDKPLPVVSETPVDTDTDTDTNADLDAGVDTEEDDTGAGVFVCENTEECLKGTKIEATLTEDSYQSYEKLVLDEIETIDEDPYISWFVTGGDLGADRSRAAASDKVFDVRWHPPLTGGSFTLFAVAHDLRGGTSWKEYRIEARASE